MVSWIWIRCPSSFSYCCCCCDWLAGRHFALAPCQPGHGVQELDLDAYKTEDAPESPAAWAAATCRRTMGTKTWVV
jgi:hypothetical protein